MRIWFKDEKSNAKIIIFLIKNILNDSKVGFTI